MFEWGVGLRPQHFKEWLQEEERPLFEILTDNYIYQRGGPALDYLDRLVLHRPPLLHGIGLNIGGRDPIDRTYLERLKKLQARTRATTISDHLCFCRGHGIETFDLLPLPYTLAELIRVEQRVNEVQDYLGQALSLENISAYVEFSDSSMTEFEFLMELCHRTGCLLLLDLNNLYVSSTNLGWDAEEQLRIISGKQISSMHVSGYSLRGQCLYDSHDQPVSGAVLELLQKAIEYGIDAPVILERDDADLDFSSLRSEWSRIQAMITPVSSFQRQAQARVLKTISLRPMENSASSDALQSDFLGRLMFDLKLRPLAGPRLDILLKSPDHWEVYVNGIVGRWTSLVDATVRRAAEVWGKPALVELLWDFASQFPPCAADINQSFRQLPLFVREHPDFGRVSGLADLLESCFLYWDLLEGDDPCPSDLVTQDPGRARLMQPAVLHRPWQAGLNLYGLWSESVLRSEVTKALEWDRLNQDEHGLLLIKSTPTNVRALPVVPSIYPMVDALVEGRSLAEAVTVLAEGVEHGKEDRVETLLREMLEKLQSAGLLCEISALS